MLTLLYENWLSTHLNEFFLKKNFNSLFFFFFAVKHLYPFNDQIVIYVRHLGPGVSVGQAWQEGTKLEQVPQKFCGEILMVKDYRSL